MDENSDMDTLVGSLTALDQDSSQKHTFKLLNSASGRFKVQGNEIKVKKGSFHVQHREGKHVCHEVVFFFKSFILSQKVAPSNKQCLKLGGSSCVLNYEAQSSHVIRVKATDNGTPQKSFEKDIRIILRDVNDQPRDLQLSNNQVKENATRTTVIGRLVTSFKSSFQFEGC